MSQACAIPVKECGARSIPSRRRGAVTVELAFTLPVLFLLILGAIEFSRANMLVNTCEIAATEGARRGIIPGATANECQQVALQELDRVGISDRQVDVQPATITANSPTITVTVQAPMNLANGYIIPRFFSGRTISKSVTLQREDGVGQTGRIGNNGVGQGVGGGRTGNRGNGSGS